MLKRWRRLVFAFLLVPFLVFMTTGIAQAAWNIGFGTTNQWYGWNYYHANCGLVPSGDFYYQGYRATPNTIQFRFQLAYNGAMKITIDESPYDSHTFYNLTGNPNTLSAPIYWVNLSPIGLPHYWWLTYLPAGGGSCNVRFQIV
jgi:hypothetical protein